MFSVFKIYANIILNYVSVYRPYPVNTVYNITRRVPKNRNNCYEYSEITIVLRRTNYPVKYITIQLGIMFLLPTDVRARSYRDYTGSVYYYGKKICVKYRTKKKKKNRRGFFYIIILLTPARPTTTAARV